MKALIISPMYLIIGLFLCIQLVFFNAALAQFSFNNNCQAAYTEIINLRLDSAKVLISKEKAINPNNLIVALLNNYTDFIEVYLFEDEKSFEQLKTNKADRLDRVKAAEESPYKRYILAEIYLHSAFAKFKYGEYFTGLLDLRRAYNLVNENYKRYPEFKPNLKLIGVLNTIIGVVPGKLKWGLQLIGLKGNLVYGMETLRNLSKEDFIFKTETNILYASMLLYLEKKPEEAYAALNDAGFPIKNNLLSYYSYATMALYSKHTDVAAATVYQSIDGFTNDKGYASFPYLHYLAGMAALNQLDTSAIAHFNTYLKRYKGKNHIKSTYQKLAWIHLINGNVPAYNAYIDSVGRYGLAHIDTDKQAQNEFETGQAPYKDLLKIRLLFDGGYYDDALDELSVTSYKSNKIDFVYELEKIYRKGRIYDEMDNKEEAISAYKSTIEMGEKSNFYYAANAALHLGYIYEKQGDLESAEKYFNKSRNMKNHEYKNSIDQKAKVALERIKK